MKPAGWTLALATLVASTGCSDDATPVGPPEHGNQARVVRLETISGHDQRFWSGKRSPQPFRVRALGQSGAAVEGARVLFTLGGEAGGVLSQPEAVTDAQGYAETFLLEARSGAGTLSANSGQGETLFAFQVDRAPGQLVFRPGSGEVGLPGLPHPDPLVIVRVLDTEGRALEGIEVWFVGPERLTAWTDTSDAQGWVSTRVERSQMDAGEGAIFAFVLGFPEVTARTTRPIAAAADRVVMVSIDGLRGDALARYAPATLSRLASEGASTTVARTVVPSLTGPAHLSLLSGVEPDTHGIWGDDLYFTPQMASLEPVFRHARRSGLAARAFMSREGPLGNFEQAFQCKLAFGLDSLTLAAPDAQQLTGAALPSIRDDAVQLVFLHLPEPDIAGHAHGFESPEYAAAVHRADSALARVVAETGEGTLLIVVSDHGGGGAYGSHLHGSDADADVRVPVILWGSRVAPRALGEVSLLDVPATALWALGFRPPFHYEGRPLLEGFR